MVKIGFVYSYKKQENHRGESHVTKARKIIRTPRKWKRFHVNENLNSYSLQKCIRDAFETLVNKGGKGDYVTRKWLWNGVHIIKKFYSFMQIKHRTYTRIGAFLSKGEVSDLHGFGEKSINIPGGIFIPLVSKRVKRVQL